MRRLSPILALLLTLAACNEAEPPQDVGVCWRVTQNADKSLRYAPLARGVDDLDTCAVLLEGLRLRGEQGTDGAYQGYFIFVNPQTISSARHVDGFRYPIFQPPQRAAVDRDLRRLMQSHGGQLPGPGEITLDKQ